MIKSTKELREFLLIQMEEVVAGNVATDVAKGVCNIAQQIYNSKLIELKMAKAQQELGDTKIEPIKFDE
jgi:hypothetical protein